VINHPDAFAGCDKSEAGTLRIARWQELEGIRR
jgi:hypothetical protein